MREEVKGSLIANYTGPLEVKNNPDVMVWLYGVCETCGLPRVVVKRYPTPPDTQVTLEVVCTDRPQQHRRFLDNS